MSPCLLCVFVSCLRAARFLITVEETGLVGLHDAEREFLDLIKGKIMFMAVPLEVQFENAGKIIIEIDGADLRIEADPLQMGIDQALHQGDMLHLDMAVRGL